MSDTLKVLLIDDSRTIRKSGENLLRKEGCEVHTCEDGYEAISRFAEIMPDLVFVDITMPRLDGYQTCSMIKNNEDFRNIPVVMLSSLDSIFDRARGRVVGASYYLTKPFTREDMAKVLREVKSNRQAAMAAADVSVTA
jgi:twitching motility two-component system response regulator PilG